MRSIRYLAALILLGASWVSAQEPFEISVDVPLVSLDVEVSDAAGRPVTTLAQEDFDIYEDGQRRPIQTFGSADRPYSLILLFDCSDSTTPEWPLLDEAVARFSRYQKPQDRVMIAAFGGKVQVIRGWNSRKDSKLQRERGVCGGTRFYDALRWAIQKQDSPKNRRGVVVLTDGIDNDIPKRLTTVGGQRLTQFVDSTSDRAFQKILRTVKDSRIPFYFVAVGTDLNPSFEIPQSARDAMIPDMREMRLRMEQLAEVSGGRVIFPRQPEDVITMYEQIGRELGTSYSLGFAANPVPDNKFHRIEVRLRSGSLELRQSRSGYTLK